MSEYTPGSTTHAVIVPEVNPNGGYVNGRPQIQQQVDPDLPPDQRGSLPFATPVTGPMTATQAQRWAQGPVPMTPSMPGAPQPAPVEVPQALRNVPERMVLSTAPAPGTIQPPKETVKFHLAELSVAFQYHEVILTKMLLALVFDTRYGSSTPPELRPTEADRPFKIEYSGVQLSAYYFGYEYSTADGRLHTILLVDVNSIERVNDHQGQ